jgi:hypothetical protein
MAVQPLQRGRRPRHSDGHLGLRGPVTRWRRRRARARQRENVLRAVVPMLPQTLADGTVEFVRATPGMVTPPTVRLAEPATLGVCPICRQPDCTFVAQISALFRWQTTRIVPVLRDDDSLVIHPEVSGPPLGVDFRA